VAREAIFISHATPQDNDFVRWLGARLELAGYAVWTDLGRLKGGDYFWDKIEKAIREESFRLLAVVSKNSVDKQGVKDEWAVGQTVEKSVPGFVIPLRLDDYEFSLLPIGIHRKNVIDFAQGWHKGLAVLQDTLTEAGALKSANPDPRAARQWLAEERIDAIKRTTSTESLDSTWLRVVSMPPALETARILGSDRKIKETPANRVIPWFEHEDRIVGFAKSSDLVSLMRGSVILTNSDGKELNAFISESSRFGDRFIDKYEARKKVLNLMRQAWELGMEARGLGVHQQAGGKKVFYVTPELTKGERVAFVDFDGRTRKKALHGRSEKRKANWAYAVGMVPSLDDPWRVELRSTIVFTDDEGKPLEAPAKAHRLRMGFCRAWWNDRWRGFLRAFLALVAEGQDEIKLPVGSGRLLVLSATPIVFTSSTGLSDMAPGIDADPVDEPDEELDEDEDEIDEGESA
jgi:hypothetical protein